MSFENCRSITLAYELRVAEGARTPIVEKTTADKPLSFISSLGMMLPDFEEQVRNLANGEAFDFRIPAAKAYGEADEKRIIDIDMDAFRDEEGKVDSEQVYVGAMLQMISEDGQRFNGIVKAIGEEKVTMDFNHKLAGKDLHFTGRMIDNHAATVAEIQDMLGQMSGCGGGCSGCKGGCGGGDCGGGGCGGCGGGCNA